MNSEAGSEPERSPSGARTEHRTPKGARDSERTLGVSKLHCSETAISPVNPGSHNAPQANQTLISLPIYMWTGTVALCKTDPVSWAQTLMPHQPVRGVLSHTPRMSARNVGGFARARRKPNGQERCGTGDRIPKSCSNVARPPSPCPAKGAPPRGALFAVHSVRTVRL